MKATNCWKVLLAGALILAGCSSGTTSTETSSETKPTVQFQMDTAVVEVEGGKLRGYVDNGVYTYKGIHYATAGRYEEPKKVEPWEGIKNVQVYGDMCPQTDMTSGLAEMINPHLFWPEEDDETQIQTLNIWSKDINATEKKPVMFWIHGGGFSTGASTEQIAYDGRNLADTQDVVVVSINHRLNVLGYLDLSEYGDEFKHSGNLGQMDIVAALQWVQDNIEQFGGDPNNVTIFGQSGGGRKVLNLMQTPSANGLFHKVICESGGQKSIDQETARAIAKSTLDKLGINQSNIEQIKTIEYDKILEAGTAALAEFPGTQWCPVVDGDFMPRDMWLDGDMTGINDVPLMIGSMYAEFTTNAFAFSADAPIDKSALTDEEVDAMLLDKFGDNKDKVVAAFKEAYPDKPIVDACYVDVMGYRYGTIDCINKKASAGGEPVFNYVFTMEYPTMGGWLPWHCSDIPFVFHNVEKVLATFGSDQKIWDMEERMSTTWATFARTGNPSNDTLGTEWLPYTVETGETMILDEKPWIGNHHDANFIAAWLGQ